MKILHGFLLLFFGLNSVSAQDQVLEKSLIPGEVFSYESKEIKFVKVLSDSRCPEGVTCIWAGNAVILVEISENGVLIEEKEVVLKPTGRNVPLLTIKDSFVLVQNLLPYPKTGTNIEDADYYLELQVQPK